MSPSQIHFSQHWNREHWGHGGCWGCWEQGWSFGAGAALNGLCRDLGLGALSRGRRGVREPKAPGLILGEAKPEEFQLCGDLVAPSGSEGTPEEARGALFIQNWSARTRGMT